MEFPSLAEMMDHRPLDQLHHCWQVVVAHIEQHARSPDELREAKRRLKKELREFTTGEPASPCSTVSSLDNQLSKQVLIHGRSTRPAGYPPAILWTYNDYKTHCHVSNQRIGSVPFAIRHGDGKPISPTEWASIAAVVRYIEYDLLVASNSRDAVGKLVRRPDTSYYKSHHREQWDVAIKKLETVCPILGLCADHWKAEMVLRWALQAQRDPEDPRRISARPGIHPEPNTNNTQPSATSSATAVKRTRDLSIIDVYPSKKVVSTLPRVASGPVHTASTSTLNAATQFDTPTHTWTNDETWRLQLKLRKLYKAQLYDFVIKRQLASVNKRTLKQDLVAIILNAVTADKSIGDEIDQMYYKDPVLTNQSSLHQ